MSHTYCTKTKTSPSHIIAHMDINYFCRLMAQPADNEKHFKEQVISPLNAW